MAALLLFAGGLYLIAGKLMTVNTKIKNLPVTNRVADEYIRDDNDTGEELYTPGTRELASHLVPMPVGYDNFNHEVNSSGLKDQEFNTMWHANQPVPQTSTIAQADDMKYLFQN
jgi:hypothetical protein